MEKQPDRLETLAALCKQKLLADPDHPRARHLARDLAAYDRAKQVGEAVKRVHGQDTK